nr:NYN domain-containing protein [Lachnospiraceae bacterium]
GPGAIAVRPGSEHDVQITESIAALSEKTIERYLSDETLADSDITELICSGTFHPVLFGSALKNEGADDLIRLITRWLPDTFSAYRKTTSAKVFKIACEQGHKLSFVKVTGGKISVRDNLPDARCADDKVTQIRIYNGGKYTTTDCAEAGDVVVLTGIEHSFAGMGIGEELDDETHINRPVLRYRMILPDDVPVRTFMPKLNELAAEDPLLDISASGDVISLSVMGEFQLEILSSVIEERFGVKVSFDSGEIIYKETIADAVMGFGHFEPLRHYAEVQLLMEPLPAGSGIEVASFVSVDDLSINWQKNIMSTILNDLPTGVLTDSVLTDIRFTIAGGRSHVKHTEGGDFREAVRRAVRQGLMKADSVLLEPYYEFVITLPADSLGRAMNDIGMMNGTASIEEQDEEAAVLSGTAPAVKLINYQSVLTSYTAGKGHIDLSFAGYRPCSAECTQAVMDEKAYDPDSDTGSPSGSVFVSHGAGEYVPWYEAEARMHIPSREAELIWGESETEEEQLEKEADLKRRIAESRGDAGSLGVRLGSMGTDEIDEIINRTSHANSGSRKGNTKRVYHERRVISSASHSNRSVKNTSAGKQGRPKYLLVDAYNIIHAWDDLKSLLSDSMYDMDGAKYRLLDILSEYRVLKECEVIAVFDAYKVKGHVTEKFDYMGVHVVYTREAETADQYIARFTVINSRELDITVATSDGLVQLIILGENAKLMSAGELLEDVKMTREMSVGHLLDRH